MRYWRSGLTHCPLKATSTGSNPVYRTIMNEISPIFLPNRVECKWRNFFMKLTLDEKLECVLLHLNTIYLFTQFQKKEELM